jgi:disulfide oxidoreductase YuzD
MKTNTATEISVLGKKIPTEIKNVKVKEVNFWVDNPRVNSLIKRTYGNKKPTDAQVEDILRNQEHVKELLQQIKNDGGLLDPILVRGKIVVEGNSRLCAYRILLDKAEQAKDKEGIGQWSTIKAQVIPDNTDEETIFSILGIWHLKGKKEWDTFEKSAYLKRMKEQYKYPVQKISEIIGESVTFVNDNIEAHDLMVKNNVYDLKKYSYFIELVKNRGIGQYEKKDNKLRDNIIVAIKDGLFNKAEEIRDLPKVLKDKVARKTFFEERVNFSEALEISKGRNPEFDDAFYRHLKITTGKLSKLKAEKALEIKNEIGKDTNKKDIIKRFGKEVNRFLKQLGLEKK